MMVNVCELTTQVTYSKNYLFTYPDLLTKKEEKNDGKGERNKGGKQKSGETKRGAEELLIHWGYAVINMSDTVLMSVFCK